MEAVDSGRGLRGIGCRVCVGFVEGRRHGAIVAVYWGCERGCVGEGARWRRGGGNFWRSDLAPQVDTVVAVWAFSSGQVGGVL